MIEAWIVYLFALPLAVFVAWRSRRNGCSAFHVAVRALFVVYLSLMIGAAFFPLPINVDLVALGRVEKEIDVSLTPGHSTYDYLRSGASKKTVVDLGGNVLVFVPFGFLLPLIATRFATWRRMLVCGLLLSLSIELGQLAISRSLGYSYRVTDVDDVVLNVAGVLWGFALWRLLRRRLPGAAAPEPGMAGDSALGTKIA